MRRRPFSAGSSIEPDTSMTASMRERSVSTAQARRISSWRRRIEVGGGRRGTLGGEPGDVERAGAVGCAEPGRGEPVGLRPRRLLERGEQARLGVSRRESATPSAVAPSSAIAAGPAPAVARSG